MVDPLISIIVPVYNTYNILIKLHRKDSKKVKVIYQDNKGVSSARNRGLQSARGKYISFIDVDDLVVPSFLEIMYEQVKGRNNAISICMSSESKRLINTENIEIECIIKADILERYLFGRISIGVCFMMCPTIIFKENNLQFAEGYKYSEDLHMVWRILCNIEKVYVINAPLYIYCQHMGSAMCNINEDRFDSIKLIGSLKSYIKEHSPDFFPLFNQFAVERMAWSLLWQVAHFLDYAEFKKFIEQYNFKEDMKKLNRYPDKRVVLSSKIFIKSKKIYYLIVKFYSRKYRSNG